MPHVEQDRAGKEPHLPPAEFVLKVKDRIATTIAAYEEVEAELKKPLVKSNGHLMRGAYYLDKIADDVMPRQRVRMEELNRDIEKIEAYLRKESMEMFGELKIAHLRDMDYETYMRSREIEAEGEGSPLRELYTSAHNAAQVVYGRQ